MGDASNPSRPAQFAPAIVCLRRLFRRRHTPGVHRSHRGSIAPDGDAYRLRIGYAEGTSAGWQRDEPLPLPTRVTGSCTRPVLVVDAHGGTRIVYTATSQTADDPDSLLDGDTGREYRRTWHLARREGGVWTQEEIYSSGEFAFGFTREEQLTRLPHAEDPALAAAVDSRGVLSVAAHTGWPTENLVFGSLSPRWRVFPVAEGTVETSPRPTVSVGRGSEPFVTWNETPTTGTYQLHSALFSNPLRRFTTGPTARYSRAPRPTERGRGLGQSVACPGPGCVRRRAVGGLPLGRWRCDMGPSSHG